MTISNINLGTTYTNSSGTTVLNGLASGLNTQSVINSIVAAQSSQITTLQDKITVNNTQTAALNTLQSLLTQVQTAAALIASPQSPDATSNLFAVNTSQITSNTTQAASNFITANVSSGATAATYDISNITQLATATSQQTQSFSVSPSTTPVVVASGAVAGQFNAGTITIAGPGGSGNVTIHAGDTLDEVAQDFNAASSSTGLTAAVTQSSTGVYTLGFTNTSTGTAVSFNLSSSTNVTSDPSGVMDEQTSAAFSLSAATNPVVVAAGTATSGQFNAGSITLTGPSGSATVTLNTGDTLSGVESDFNSVEGTTGITASLLQTSPGVYQLVFSSTTTGAATLFDMTNTAKSGTVTDGGNNVLGNISFQTMSQANGNEGQDASFELNGTTITRPTNNISDLVSGVTFNLLQNTSGVTGANFTLQITPDVSSIATGIQNFATAYNNFLTFYATQTQLNSSGTPASAAVLYSDSTLRNIYNQLSNEATSIVAGIASANPNQLSDIGISFTNTAATSTAPSVSNTLSVDTTTLESLLTSNISQVEAVLGNTLTSSSSNVVLYQSATASTVQSFKLNVNPSTSTYTGTYTDSSNVSHTVNFTAASLGSGGYSLTADSTSALAGLVLIYGSTEPASNISVSLSQGIAGQMNSLVTSALTTTTGSIAEDEAAITTSNTSLQKNITSITTQVANTRTSLLQKYSALEAAINQANSTLTYLNAQQNAASSSSG